MSPPRAPARPLSRQAGELLAARATLETTSISRRADRTRALLLPAQQRIWLHDQIEGRAGYVRPVALRINGPLDVRALEQALATIMARHEALHSRLDAGADGMPLLRMVAGAAPALTIHDLGTPLPVPGTRLVDPQILAEAHRPFDLTVEAPVRVSLFRHGPDAHLLLTVFHHIAFDGWSVAVYLRELSAAYAAARAGTGDGLGELVLQCGDIAESTVTGRTLPRDLDYWRGAVRGVESALALPLDHPRRPGQGRDASRVALGLPPALVNQLRELSRREGVSLFMTFAAAFQVLLSRYSRQEDFLVGIPIAGRTRPEMDGLIGCFISTLALRCDLTGSPTFRELLQRVRRHASGAMAHQAVPFEQVLRLLGNPDDRQLPAGAQVLFNFRNLPPATAHLDGLMVGQIDVPLQVTLFDLELDLTDTGSAIHGSIVCPAALFDQATAERLAGHLRTLLEAAVADPGCAAARMPMLAEAERRELLGALSGGASPGALPGTERGCVHQSIAGRAIATPDATAISGPGGELTYAALMARAQDIAGTLRASGVRRGDRVGLAIERSPDLMAAMLGVMFAGAAYVPLDPDYPDARLAFIVSDASLRCIVTDRVSERRLAGIAEAPLVAIEAIGPLAPDSPTSAGPATPDDAAYVIYTSGSTGTPKGVVIGHRALAAFSAAATDGFGITERDRFLQFSTPNFDASVVEIFPTLAAGAAVVLRDAAMAQSVEGFVSGCERWGVTLAVPATAFWHEVVGALAEAGKMLPSSIRLMGPGGERMLPERAAQWRQVAPHATLFNAYGPTETTVHVTRYEVPADFDARGGTVPIGAPIPTVPACVLDSNGDLAPRGAPGELHIGGAQLADGYLNRPELTAERFVPSPFSAGERLYRTGDLVRWRNDGQLEYLGRLDRQVKVRGFRVEIGEIESALLASDAVLECAVETRESAAGDQRLIAYVVPAGASLDIEALGDHLRQRLPSYMVPALVAVPTIPRTPNGKLDRGSLPDLALQTGVGSGHAEPRSPLEFQLVQLWERLLDVRPVGVRDDFFALGGHSLLAMRMTCELERTCGHKLPLSTLFHASTIEQVAAELVRAAAPTADGRRMLLNAGGTRPPLVFLHGDVLGGGLYCREVAKRLGPDQPMYVIGPGGPGDPATIEAMAEAALEWIRGIAGGRYRLAGFCNGGLVAYEIARQLERKGERTELLFLIDVPPRNVGLGGLERVLKWAAGSADADEALAARAARMRRAADLLQRARAVWAKGWNHRLRVAVRKAHGLLLPDRPPGWMGEQGAAPGAAATMLAFVSRAVNAYVPRRYGGPVHVVAARTGLREARRWAQSAPSLTVHDASVDHQAVVTMYVPGALRTCLAALDGDDTPPPAGLHPERS